MQKITCYRVVIRWLNTYGKCEGLGTKVSMLELPRVSLLCFLFVCSKRNRWGFRSLSQLYFHPHSRGSYLPGENFQFSVPLGQNLTWWVVLYMCDVLVYPCAYYSIPGKLYDICVMCIVHPCAYHSILQLASYPDSFSWSVRGNGPGYKAILYCVLVYCSMQQCACKCVSMVTVTQFLWSTCIRLHWLSDWLLYISQEYWYSATDNFTMWKLFVNVYWMYIRSATRIDYMYISDPMDHVYNPHTDALYYVHKQYYP